MLATGVKPVAAHDHSADGADGAGLIDGCNTHDDGAQHRKNQRQRWHQRQQHPDDKLKIVVAFVGDRRRTAGLNQSSNEDVAHVQPHQHQTWKQGPHEHLTSAR